MKKIELVPGVFSSRIGFGCAPILGSVDRAKALRALAVAREVGVTHFDIAPSYGYGEAEGLLGEFLAGSGRDGAVIATKYGIEANQMAQYLRPLKGIARSVIKAIKRGGGSGAKAGSGVAGSMLKPVTITAEGLEKSVERSLRRMRTDRIDLLFLHEPATRVADLDGVLRTMERLKAAGKVRGFGLSLMRSTWGVHSPDLGKFDVLQFDAPSLNEGGMPERADAANVLFSPFRAAAEGQDRPSILRDLSTAFPRSVILCSMFGEAHIRANVQAVSEGAKV